VERVTRYLALVVAVFASWTVADSPRPFATASTSPSSALAQIARAIPEREVAHGQKFIFGNFFTFVTPGSGAVISRTPGGPGEAHVDDKPNINDTTPNGPRHVTCPDGASAVLRPVLPNYPVPSTGALRTTVYYGQLVLRFTASLWRDDSLCTLVSQRAALPIIADVRTAPNTDLTAVAYQQIAASVTTASLDLIPTPTDIHRCDLSLMQSLSYMDLIDSTKPLPSGSQQCYLNAPRSVATNGLTARWSIPGFEEYTPDEHGIRLYKTQALTYYVDLNSLLASSDVSSINSAVIDCLENYIHQTLIKNLPALTPIGIAQVWPAI
jgi:hypothetical protein